MPKLQHIATIGLAGRALAIASEPTRALDYVLDKFLPFAQEGLPHGLSVTVSIDRSLAQIESADVTTETAADGTMTIRGDGAIASFDPASRTLAARINDTDAERGSGSIENMIRPAFQYLLLRDGGGFLMHGGTAALAGRGLAYPGYSGAGKTTLSRLIYENGGTLLSDDLSVVTRTADGYEVCGSPFYGSERTMRRSVSPAPLAAIYFLRHGPLTAIEAVSPAETARRFVTHIPFLQMMPRDVLNRLLDDAAALAEAVPGFGFPFVPDAGAVAAIGAHIQTVEPRPADARKLT